MAEAEAVLAKALSEVNTDPQDAKLRSYADSLAAGALSIDTAVASFAMLLPER
jgi:hypothetical protein